MKSETRIIPFYLRNASKICKSMVFDDTEVGYGLRATEKHIPSFEEKIATIINYSIYSLNSTEKRYPKLIKEILPNDKIIEEKLISKKIMIFGDLGFTQKQVYHYIQSSYMEIFNTLKEIFIQFGIFTSRNPSKNRTKYLTLSEDILIDAIYNTEIVENVEFRNRVLSLIFPLQIQIYEINKIINSPPGIPADPAIKKIRSSLGGEIKSYGESILLDRILDFLSNKRPTSDEFMYSSTAELFKEHEADLGEILEKYRQLKGCSIKTGGPKIYYGSSLITSGILRKMLQWSKNNSEFNTELKKHIKKKSPKRPNKGKNAVKYAQAKTNHNLEEAWHKPESVTSQPKHADLSI